MFDPSETLVLPATTEGTRRSLTGAERAAFMLAVDQHYCGLFFLTLLCTGLRPGEASALIWKDIDFKANEIHVYKAVETRTGAIKDPKTAAGIRDIPMQDILRQKLWEARSDDLFQRVFLNSRGGTLSEKSRFVAWNSFKELMALYLPDHQPPSDLTAYCLRHTFCTDLQRAGVPINVAKELMGHSDIQMTANIYTHRDQDLLHENIKKLSSVGQTVGLSKNSKKSG